MKRLFVLLAIAAVIYTLYFFSEERNTVEVKEITTSVWARILTNEETSKFSMAGAVVGGIIGSQLGQQGTVSGAIIGGSVGAKKECVIAVIAQSEKTPQVVKAPLWACEKLKSNNQIVLLKYERYRKDKSGQLWYRKEYAWSEKWNREPR